jgi:hypothetical protein
MVVEIRSLQATEFTRCVFYVLVEEMLFNPRSKLSPRQARG